jgi:hypothetical protein
MAVDFPTGKWLVRVGPKEVPMFLSHSSKILALASLLLVCSCGQGNAADKAAGGDKPYTVTLGPQSITAGVPAVTTLTIHAKDGFKWNDEFPASLDLTLPQEATATSYQFTKKDGTVQNLGKAGALTINLTASKCGPLELKLKGNFSLCTETSCRIFRAEELTSTLTVTAK